MEQGEEERGFLPPEPSGPEPELGAAPAPPPPTQPQPPPQPQPVPQQPFGQPGYPQYPPAQPGQGWQQPQAQPPPPGYGWQQQPPPPPGYGWQAPPPGAYPAAPGWAYPQEPDNGSAVAGFVLAMVSLGLWLFTLGLSSILSLGCAIAGLIYARRGKKKVQEGETRKHKGLAQAGFISSIVMIVMSALSTAGWAAFWIAYATDDEFRRDVDGDSSSDDQFFNDTFGDPSALRVVIPLVRGAIQLLT